MTAWSKRQRGERPSIRVVLEDAAVVVLAARLLSRHSDEPNPAGRASIGTRAAVMKALATTSKPGPPAPSGSRP